MASIPPPGGIGVFAVDEQVSVSRYLLHTVFPCNLILSFEGWGLLYSSKRYPLTCTRYDNMPPTKPRSLGDCSDKEKKPQGKPPWGSNYFFLACSLPGTIRPVKAKGNACLFILSISQVTGRLNGKHDLV
jgi:hypothetical protein